MAWIGQFNHFCQLPWSQFNLIQTDPTTLGAAVGPVPLSPIHSAAIKTPRGFWCFLVPPSHVITPRSLGYMLNLATIRQCSVAKQQLPWSISHFDNVIIIASFWLFPIPRNTLDQARQICSRRVIRRLASVDCPAGIPYDFGAWIRHLLCGDYYVLREKRSFENNNLQSYS